MTDELHAFQCDDCSKWWCLNCINKKHPNSVSELLYEHLHDTSFPFSCTSCKAVPIPHSLLSEDLFTAKALREKYEIDAKWLNLPKVAQSPADPMAAITAMLQHMQLQQQENQQFRQQQQEQQQQLLQLLATNHHNGVRPSAPTRNARLPKLDIEKFHGDPLKWSAFWDYFKTAIDQTDLGELEKYHYLRSFVGGTALASIQGLEISAVNYPKAIEILKERFGNEEKMVELNYTALFDLQPTSADTGKLRNFLDAFEQRLKQLEALGQQVNTNDAIVSFLQSKLPYEVRSKLNESKLRETSWSLDLFRKEFGQYVRDKEDLQLRAHIQSETSGGGVTSRTSPSPDRPLVKIDQRNGQTRVDLPQRFC
ncbi:MAG: DUF1759 domain-containing protein [Gammaproteobacteria bacterium]|nr:DUF1759 domain-containing protein [Gammaproteobacteria bacterium]